MSDFVREKSFAHNGFGWRRASPIEEDCRPPPYMVAEIQPKNYKPSASPVQLSAKGGCVALVGIENVNGVRSVLGSARTMAQLRNAIIKQMMSTATDAELIALGERFEKLLLEYVDAWLAWAPLMRAARAEAEADIAILAAAIQRNGCDVAQARISELERKPVGVIIRRQNHRHTVT